MKTKILSIASEQAIPEAIRIIQKGGVIGFPTDTVYGLGVSIHHEVAIYELFQIKGRDFNKAIAVLVGSLDQVHQVAAGFPPLAEKLAASFWPGPLTIVVQKSPLLPAIISPNEGIGIRVPDLAFTRALLLATGPLATTSANLSGGANSLDATEVMDQIGDKFALLLDGGKCPGGVPSTVVNCQGIEPVIIRAGAIERSRILDAINQ